MPPRLVQDSSAASTSPGCLACGAREYASVCVRARRGNSIRRVARSGWRAARVARSVARSYGPPAAPSGPATYKHREGSGSRRSCPIVAQNHRDVDLLRAAQSRRWCGSNWLARRAPTDGPARCLSAKIVPHCERIIVSHAKHAWIADSVTQTDSAADRSFGHC